MGQLPVNLRPSPDVSEYEKIWDAVRATVDSSSGFDARMISKSCGRPVKQVRDYLGRWVKAGYLQQIARTPCGSVYQVLQAPARAPCVRRDGSVAPERSPTAQDYMWRAVKMIGTFTARDLALAASTEEVPVTLSSARAYACALAHAGYLQIVEKGRTNGTLTRYRLLMSANTGPRAPMIQTTRAVYDLNVRKVVWTAVGGVVK